MDKNKLIQKIQEIEGMLAELQKKIEEIFPDKKNYIQISIHNFPIEEMPDQSRKIYKNGFGTWLAFSIPRQNISDGEVVIFSEITPEKEKK